MRTLTTIPPPRPIMNLLYQVFFYKLTSDVVVVVAVAVITNVVVVAVAVTTDVVVVFAVVVTSVVVVV